MNAKELKEYAQLAEERPARFWSMRARLVSDAMIRIRGVRPGDPVSDELLNDVYATMLRHWPRYMAGIRYNEQPEHTAQDIQDAEWDLAADEREAFRLSRRLR